MSDLKMKIESDLRVSSEFIIPNLIDTFINSLNNYYVTLYLYFIRTNYFAMLNKTLEVRVSLATMFRRIFNY